MKAAFITRYGGPERMQVGQLPTPVPGPGEVLVEVAAASLNPVDFKIREGKLKPILPLSFPLVLGNDLAGVVRGLGAGVTRFSVGDEVYGRVDKVKIGTLCEWAAVRADALAKKPARANMIEAASLPLVGLTAWQALLDIGQLAHGQRVFVQAGAGGVGTFAIQLAKAKGALVTTTASGVGAELVRRLGADEVIDYRYDDFVARVREQHIVFDTLGGRALAASFRCVRRGGVVVSIAGPPTVDMARENQVKPVLWPAFWAMSWGAHRRAARHGARYVYLFMRPSGSALEEIAALVDAGRIQPVIDKVFALDDAAKAMAYLESGKAKGKVVVRVR